MPKPKTPYLFLLSVAAITISTVRTARARMPAVPEAQLKKSSTLIIEAVVVSTRLTHSKRTATLKRARYRSGLKITKTLKGDKKPGEIVSVSWHTVKWIGKGPTDDGHFAYPTFHPCEKVSVYLSGRGKTHTVTAWNGKRTLKAAPSGSAHRLPTGKPGGKGAVVRCADDSATQSPPRPPPAVRPTEAPSKESPMSPSPSPDTGTPAADTDDTRAAKRKRCGCGHGHGTGGGGVWVLLLMLLVAGGWSSPVRNAGGAS